MSSLSPETAFQIDFNVHRVAAAIGVEMSDAAVAAIFGISAGELIAYLQEVADTVAASAAQLLTDPALSAALTRWDVSPGARVLMMGDSITTYRYGYARLFAAMLALARPEDDIQVENVAQSGFTTTHGLELTYTQLLAQNPDWVFIKFGGNDCKQFGGPDAPTLVPEGLYRQNLRRMATAFRQHAQANVVLITPTPVVENITNTLPDFVPMRMTWDNRTLAAFAEAMREVGRELDLPVVDFNGLMGAHPHPANYLSDGLHPGPDGHKLMAQELLQSLP